MHEPSTDSDVTFRRDIGSAEILPTRPGIDTFEDTRPMPDVIVILIHSSIAYNCDQSVCHCDAAIAYAVWVGASFFLLHLQCRTDTCVNNISPHNRTSIPTVILHTDRQTDRQTNAGVRAKHIPPLLSEVNNSQMVQRIYSYNCGLIESHTWSIERRYFQ